MAPIAEGAAVPNVTFVTRVRIPADQAEKAENPFDWKKVTTEDLMKVRTNRWRGGL
jgi:peroxiredoxin